MSRERLGGADVDRPLRGTGGRLDWPRTLPRFDRHWRALLSHLLLLG